MEIRFTVMGEPQGKARPRFSFKTGKTYTPKNTKDYENHVKSYASLLNRKFNRNIPLEVNIKAYYKMPASTSKKVKIQMANGEILPTKKPDCDNVIKIILDALNGVLYEDDAQVCRVNFEKLYSDKPCVSISIKTIGLTTREIEEALKNICKENRLKRRFDTNEF